MRDMRNSARTGKKSRQDTRLLHAPMIAEHAMLAEDGPMNVAS
jgi:hypothetical protein